MVKSTKPEINLFINKAKVSRISLSEIGIDVIVDLVVGDKTLTSMSLASESYLKDSPRYIEYTEDMKRLYDKLLKIVQKQAVLSLEHIQPTLDMVPEAEIDK